MGRRVSASEEKMAGEHIASASHAHGRTADDGKWHGGTGQDSGGSVARGRRLGHAGPELAEVGQAMKNPRQMENWMPKRFGPKSELGCRFDFEFYFKDLSLKSKVSNKYFQTKFELRSN
jgi:hypothetical protein